MENRPEWMNDSLVKNMDGKKLQFLSEFILGGKGKSQKEAIPYMMLKMKQAKAENITFSSSDIAAVVAAIKKYSTPEEKEQIDYIIKRASNK